MAPIQKLISNFVICRQLSYGVFPRSDVFSHVVEPHVYASLAVRDGSCVLEPEHCGEHLGTAVLHPNGAKGARWAVTPKAMIPGVVPGE